MGLFKCVVWYIHLVYTDHTSDSGYYENILTDKLQWNPGITVTLGTDENGRNLGMAVFVK